MVRLVLLLTCCLTHFTQVTPTTLTKQIPPEAFKNLLEDLRKPPIHEFLANIIYKPSEEAALNLIKLFNKNQQPEIQEILNASNAAFGVRLFVLNGDFVELDDEVFEASFWHTVEAIFPDLRRPRALQKKVNSGNKVSTREFTIGLSFPPALAVEEAFQVLLYTICNTVLGNIAKATTDLLTQISINLDNFTITSENPLLMIIPKMVNIIVDGLKEIVQSLIDLLTSSSVFKVCYGFNPGARRRRDLVASNRDFSLGFLHILEILFGLTSSALNKIFKYILEGIWSSFNNYTDLIRRLIIHLVNVVDVLLPVSS